MNDLDHAKMILQHEAERMAILIKTERNAHVISGVTDGITAKSISDKDAKMRSCLKAIGILTNQTNGN